MAILIPARGDPRPIDPADGRSFTLAELEGLVGGDVEILPTEFLVEFGREPLVAVLNENGKRLELPRNRYASAMFRKSLFLDDYIVGDVVLCTLREAGESDEH